MGYLRVARSKSWGLEHRAGALRALLRLAPQRLTPGDPPTTAAIPHSALPHTVRFSTDTPRGVIPLPDPPPDC